MKCEKCEQNKRERLKRIAICVVVIFASVISLFSCSKSESGVDEAIERYINLACYFECDKDELMAMAPDQFWKVVDIREVYPKLKEVMKQELENEGGADFQKKLKVDWEIGYRTTLSVEECRNIEKELEDKHGINYSVIDEAFSFTLEAELAYEESDDKEEIDLIAIKMDDKWYLASFEEGYGDDDGELVWMIEDLIDYVLW